MQFYEAIKLRSLKDKFILLAYLLCDLSRNSIEVIMKFFYAFVFMFVSHFILAQDFQGKYYRKIEAQAGELLEYTLELKEENTYKILIHRNIKRENSQDEYFKGNGTWTQEKHKIIFTPKLTGEKNEIDMTAVVARFNPKKQNELLFYTKQKMEWVLNVGMKKQ